MASPSSLTQRLQAMINAPPAPTEQERKNLAAIIEWLAALDQDASDLSGKIGLTDDEFKTWNDKLEPVKMATIKRMEEEAAKNRLTKATKLLADNSIDFDLSGVVGMTSTHLDMVKEMVRKKTEAVFTVVDEGKTRLSEAKKLIAENSSIVDGSIDLGDKTTLTSEELEQIKMVINALKAKTVVFSAAAAPTERIDPVEKKTVAIPGPKGSIVKKKKKKSFEIFSSKCKVHFLKTCVELMDLDCSKRKNDMIEALNKNVTNHGEKVLLRLGGKSELAELCELHEVSALGKKADQIRRLLDM